MDITKILLVNHVNNHALIVLHYQYVHRVKILLINQDRHVFVNQLILWMPLLCVKVVLLLAKIVLPHHYAHHVYKIITFLEILVYNVLRHVTIVWIFLQNVHHVLIQI